MAKVNYEIDDNKLYQETYRPQFHFSPRRNWMNDPNGLVYYDGEYHLFYQYHPEDNIWGAMHWGHAVSKDLVHWDHLPIALEPDEKLGMVFSGSAVVDYQDTTGFFAGDSGLVIIYTNCRIDPETKEELQEQSIAYSKDNGRSWTKYSGNPVLVDPEVEDFRDPKVIWYQPMKRWIMILACGDRVKFYGSNNLKDWNYLSEFGVQAGSHEGVWECPDLFKLPVKGTRGEQKWVLEVDVQDGAPAGGSGAQYFIGEFDGEKFINNNSAEDNLWVDYGADFYAVQSWANIPEDDGRRLWLGWMSNWDYAERVPTEKWRGAMTVPREVGLTQTDDGIRLVQKPAAELHDLRERKSSWESLKLNSEVNFTLNDMTAPLEIIAEVESSSAEEFGFKIGKLGIEETIIGYNTAKEEVFVDRTNSGKIDFKEGFAAKHAASLKPQQNKIKLQILVDRSSVELFANEGKVTITDLIFPQFNEETIELYVEGGEISFELLEIYELKSIWQPNQSTSRTCSANY